MKPTQRKAELRDGEDYTDNTIWIILNEDLSPGLPEATSVIYFFFYLGQLKLGFCYFQWQVLLIIYCL